MKQSDNFSTWSEQPAAILIMGKWQGSQPLNRQLQGRVAMAVALWHCAPHPKPYLMFVASDTDPQRQPNAQHVKERLRAEYHIPGDYLIMRQKTNCTILEVRMARVLRRVHQIDHIFAVTHLYHAGRVRKYLTEVLPNTSVIPAHATLFDDLHHLPEDAAWFDELKQEVASSQPSLWQEYREYFAEAILNLLHTVDRRGRLERSLANYMRRR